MSRYIDADALKYYGNHLDDEYEAMYHDAQWVYRNQIDDAPSIDIVFCKECKHNPWDFDRTDYTCIWDDDFADRPQTPDDFCSYGERR